MSDLHNNLVDDGREIESTENQEAVEQTESHDGDVEIKVYTKHKAAVAVSNGADASLLLDGDEGDDNDYAELEDEDNAAPSSKSIPQPWASALGNTSYDEEETSQEDSEYDTEYDSDESDEYSNESAQADDYYDEVTQSDEYAQNDESVCEDDASDEVAQEAESVDADADKSTDEDSAFKISDEEEPIITFDSLELSEEVLKAIKHEGFEQPTPIQLRSIPVVMNGRDMIGQAQTGTGKTAAFALPILSKLPKRQKNIFALILEQHGNHR